jgi:hypothetical protein
MLRAITDDEGILWQVWEVIPGSPRLAGPTTGRMPNVWGGAAHRVPSSGASPGLDEGWLVFMTDASRRRLAPIPPGWVDLDDAGLLRLLAQAA